MRSREVARNGAIIYDSGRQTTEKQTIGESVLYCGVVYSLFFFAKKIRQDNTMKCLSCLASVPSVARSTGLLFYVTPGMAEQEYTLLRYPGGRERY